MYSYALSRAASEEDLIAAYLATAARFEKHIASLDVVEAAQCDEQCLVLLEELCSCMSATSEEALRYKHITEQAEENTERRAAALQRAIKERHAAKKAERTRTLGGNGVLVGTAHDAVMHQKLQASVF